MGALAVILDEQYKVSRNLGESLWRKIHRMFWSVVYLCAAFRVAIAAMRNEQLGSRITYDSRPGVITNFAQHQTPSVKLDDGEYIRCADRAQIVNVRSMTEYLHRFSLMFWWYATSWHGINVNKRLYPAAFSRQA